MQTATLVLRDAVGHYYREVRGEEAGGLRHFARHVGAYRSGAADTSERYKDLLTDSLLARQQGR